MHRKENEREKKKKKKKKNSNPFKLYPRHSPPPPPYPPIHCFKVSHTRGVKDPSGAGEALKPDLSFNMSHSLTPKKPTSRQNNTESTHHKKKPHIPLFLRPTFGHLVRSQNGRGKAPKRQ